MPVIVRRKKPIEVATLQWTGDNTDEVAVFCGTTPISLHKLPGVDVRLDAWNSEEHQFITIPIGHHLVRGPLGELYPLSPAALDLTYDTPEDPS